MECAICLGSMSDGFYTLEPCNHRYCQVCLESWSKEQTQCPLCTRDFLTAKFVQNGIEELRQFAPQKIKLTEKFECLDHAYFSRELQQLSNLAKSIEVTRFKQRNSPGTPAEWKFFAKVKDRVDQLILENSRFMQYNAQSLLDEVYSLEADLRAVKNGNVPQEEEYQEEYYSDCSEEFYEEDY
jgi:hypothetical protein